MVLDLRSRPTLRPSLSFVLLFLLLAVLWVAGGASHELVSGQALVRTAAAISLVLALLFGKRPALSGIWPVALFLGAAIALALLQLIPLPPGAWQALPGRSIFVEGAQASNIGQPWRPISIVPGATVNAAASLIVPTAVLVLVSGLPTTERGYLPGLILSFMAMSMIVGLLQFSGGAITNPLINATPGEVSGSFANRNHLALFLALGCQLAPVWAFLDGRQPRWRGPTAFGLVLLFVLTILASGSRAGLILGVLGLGIGLLLVWRGIRRALSGYPRWVFVSLVSAAVAAIPIFVLVSFALGRAMSINRALELDPEQDLRARALPTVIEMARDYFPWGSGLGSFERIFRVHEPFALLGPTYFNHAHNDLLEIVVDAGLPGLLALAAGLLWWLWASIRAWLAGGGVRYALPKLGAAFLLLIIMASAFDYPARTPMMMAMIVIASAWLSDRIGGPGHATLPKSSHSL